MVFIFLCAIMSNFLSKELEVHKDAILIIIFFDKIMYYILLHTVQRFLFLQIIMLTFIFIAFCHSLVKITVWY